ncbi:response regulator [Candidatus Solirubrobacter pratensis]|jgi:DNA-binding NarL/FixJ family response regulator|uniref:response regulator n=1 Tax=Candidatus Solirubrobacter pratensis TaxID=1298857 RepID=UPI0003FE69B1|nr:response regulator [Candidatus Solirubrobacter pratensis]
MSKRVLVVDDHPAVALALKLRFRVDGRFELAGSAATAAAGLEQAPGQDAILLDLRLPDLSGPELVVAFRERAPGVPLVLHSADDDTPAVAAVRDLVDAVALKGDADGVLAALARVTGG